MVLDNDGKFQLEGEDGHVALLDFEDGSADCADTGNADLNRSVVGTVPAGDYDGVLFDVGIPFALNHLDVATAEPPLNISAMYWAWATGHKFLRLDLDVGGVPWNVHLGSTMCASSGMTAPPGTECARPNRPTIEIDGMDIEADVIAFDVAPLVADSDIEVNTGMPTPGCMSFPHDEPDCANLFPNLGLDYSSGACTSGCTNQSVFAAQ